VRNQRVQAAARWSGQAATISIRQEDTNQSVRLWGDTAVVTAKLLAKGTDGEKPFDVSLWFSDTYVKTPAGWKYVFGQAACHLPTAP
jgi:ketosteroid isomerase-like protein